MVDFRDYKERTGGDHQIKFASSRDCCPPGMVHRGPYGAGQVIGLCFFGKNLCRQGTGYVGGTEIIMTCLGQQSQNRIMIFIADHTQYPMRLGLITLFFLAQANQGGLDLVQDGSYTFLIVSYIRYTQGVMPPNLPASL